MVAVPLARIEAFKKKDKANANCAVCGAYTTNVLIQFNSFVCSRCSGLLREAGFTVKGVTMTNWSAADAEKICNGGNTRERQELCAGWNGADLVIDTDSPDNDVRRFIGAKYVEKRWAGRGGASGSSSRAVNNVSSSKGNVLETAKRVASMFHDLTEARAIELIEKFGSAEEAIEQHLAGQAEPEAQRGDTSARARRPSLKRASSRKGTGTQEFGQQEQVYPPPSPSTSYSAPAPTSWASPAASSDYRPRGIGPMDVSTSSHMGAYQQPAPSRMESTPGMAGMVGLVARGEIQAPQGVTSRFAPEVPSGNSFNNYNGTQGSSPAWGQGNGFVMQSAAMHSAGMPSPSMQCAGTQSASMQSDGIQSPCMQFRGMQPPGMQSLGMQFQGVQPFGMQSQGMQPTAMQNQFGGASSRQALGQPQMPSATNPFAASSFGSQDVGSRPELSPQSSWGYQRGDTNPAHHHHSFDDANFTPPPSSQQHMSEIERLQKRKEELTRQMQQRQTPHFQQHQVSDSAGYGMQSMMAPQRPVTSGSWDRSSEARDFSNGCGLGNYPQAPFPSSGGYGQPRPCDACAVSPYNSAQGGFGRPCGQTYHPQQFNDYPAQYSSHNPFG